MKSKLILFATLGTICSLCSCVHTSKHASEMTGNDRDRHGCIGSAGYTWSVVQNKCIRIFEQGVRVEDGNKNSCYIVFGHDSLQVELFFSGQTTPEHPVLDRRPLPKGGWVWNTEDDDTKNVRCIDGVWVIEQRGKEIFQQVK